MDCLKVLMNLRLKKMCALWILVIILLIQKAHGCGYPGSPAHADITFSTEVITTDTVATYSCEPGFELLGPVRRFCQANGTWVPQGIPFCVLNVASGKACMQSSTSGNGHAQKAVDGSTGQKFSPETCSLTEAERAPWWYVNLLEPYYVQLVRVDFGRSCCGKGKPATVIVRVGNNRPDQGVNPICSRYTGPVEEGRPLFLPCNPPMAGAFVSIQVDGGSSETQLSLCEAFVYTDQALSIEVCPTFRDQPLGSTATYGGRCYTFYNNQPATFSAAQQMCEIRGGSLLTEASPSLQGFLSWELWRRHRDDPDGQYWLGAVRDKRDPKNWKWIDGEDVTVSFWTLPGGRENCSRLDGTKGWLWSDTNCFLSLYYICQFRPRSCGRPAQPPNSTLQGSEFQAGSQVKYTCDTGHDMQGPASRQCLATGFYTEYPPFCKYMECGLPASIQHGSHVFLNGTRTVGSKVKYTCNGDLTLVGHSQLTCDVTQQWDGPPPTCKAICPEPEPIAHGKFTASSSKMEPGTELEYVCEGSYTLMGSHVRRCLQQGRWDSDAPTCSRTSLTLEETEIAEVPITNNLTSPVSSLITDSFEILKEISAFVDLQATPDPNSHEYPDEFNLYLKAFSKLKFPYSSSLGTNSGGIVIIPAPPPSTASPITPPQTVPITSSTLPPSSPTTTVPTTLPTTERGPLQNWFTEKVESPEFSTTHETENVIKDRIDEDVSSLENGEPVRIVPFWNPETESVPETTTLTQTSFPSTTTEIPSTTFKFLPTNPEISEASTLPPSHFPESMHTTRTRRPVPARRRTPTPTTTTSTSTSTITSTTTTTTTTTEPPPPPTTTITTPIPTPEIIPETTTSTEQPTTIEYRVPANVQEGPSNDVKTINSPGKPDKDVASKGGKDLSTAGGAILDTGAIIALSVFGAFVILIILITIIVILCRRRKMRNGLHDNTTISTYDSSSSEGQGLTKYYKRAWENLQVDPKTSTLTGAHHLEKHPTLSRLDTLDTHAYNRSAGRGTIEGMRDSNEMTVNDATAWNTRRERKHKHHHHHRNRGYDSSDENDRPAPGSTWYSRNGGSHRMI